MSLSHISYCQVSLTTSLQWDLSIVSASLNIPTRLSVSDGQSVQCLGTPCDASQVYTYTDDYAADRNSALGQTYTHTFCP